MIGLASSWCGPDGRLFSPVLWRGDGGRGLGLHWRDPEDRLDGRDRCVAASQAAA
jgi:hypothetical protein